MRPRGISSRFLMRGTPLLCLLALALLPAAVQGGPLMAVDLGGEFLKVSVVKPGRTPVSIVNNEMSKRRTSAQVAFVGGERLLGEEAAALAVRFPDRVLARTRELLGKPAKHESVAALLKGSLLPYTVVEEPARKSVAVKAHTGESYTAEELVGSILHYAQRITTAASEGVPVPDCVLVVPPFYGPAQRQALIDAAQLTGLNVLGLINSHAAAALQYGIEKDFTNRTEWVVLYDMGATSTEAALIKYSSFSVREAGRPKTYSQFEVVDVTWDAALGGERLDLLLLDHFASEFQAKHAVDIRTFPKAVAKLKRQVKRTKEILSANTEAPISVEELHDGIDFRSRITREAFEGLAGTFFTEAGNVLKRLLEGNHQVVVPDLTAIELIGGSTRVPAVQAALQGVLGGRTLDKHLDADEAVVLGAGLFAANLSTTFRLRKFGMADGVTYPLTFQLDAPKKGKEADASVYAPRPLLPFLKRLPAKRVVHLPPGARDPLTFALSFNESSPTQALPPGASSPLLGAYEVTGFNEVLKKQKDVSQWSVTFRADTSGLVTVEKAEGVVEVQEEYTVKVLSKNTTTGNFSAPEAPAAEGKNETLGNATAASPPPPVYETVTKTRTKTLRLPLRVGGAGLTQPGLTAAQLKASKEVMAKLEKADATKRESAAAKDALERYIIATRGALDEDSLTQVSMEKEREEFREELNGAEDWLYTEGEAETGPVFRERLKTLQGRGNPLAFRAAELVRRPKAVKDARGFLELTRTTVDSWATLKPWINSTDIDLLKLALDAYERWLDGEEGKQAKLKASEDPVLKSAELEARLAEPRALFNKLKAKKMPKPPPAPAPAPSPEGDAESAGKEGESAQGEGTASEGDVPPPPGAAEDLRDEL